MGKVGYRVFLLLVAIMGVVSSPLFGQKLNFRNIDSSDGLYQEQVTAIYQDSDGYVWLGSFSGVTRYNGYQLERKFTEKGQLTNHINAIGGDEQGNLYFASAYDGLFLKQGESLKKIILGSDPLSNSVYSISKDNEGGIYFGTANGLFTLKEGKPERVDLRCNGDLGYITGVYFLDEKHFYLSTSIGFYYVESGQVSRIPFAGELKSVFMFTAVEDGDGNIFVGSNDGLYRYTNGKLVKEQITAISHFGNIAVNAVYYSPYDEALWFGCELGLIRRSKTETRLYNTENGLLHNTIRTIYVDRERNLWLGTNLGLSILRSSAFVSYTKDSGLRSPSVSDLGEDSKGRILGANGASGLCIIDKNIVRYPGENEGFLSAVVFGVGETSTNKIILGNKHDVSAWDGKSSKVLLAPVNTHSTLTDSQGRVWVCSSQGVLLIEDDRISEPLKNLFPDNTSVYGMREDKNGRIWFCSRERGCLVWDGSQLSIVGKEQGLTEESVWSVDFDSQNRAWIGTNGSGVFIYDGKSMEIINDQNGLPDNYVWQVLIDNDNRAWIGTNEGITRFDGEEFVLFTVDDGLAGNEGQADACLKDSQGNLWFASSQGISRYIDRKYSRIYDPRMTIETITVDDEIIDSSETALFSPEKNNIRFTFSALSYRAPKKIEYRYILLGAEENWNTLNSYGPVSYSKLSPGKYTFSVKAGYLGKWSDTTSYSFIIRKPFYIEWWFYLFILLSSAGFIYITMNYRARRTEREKVILNKLVEKRAKELISANEELKTFSTAVSNNLLVPLRHITGFCELIWRESGGKLDKVTQDYLKKIVYSAERQRKLINDLLRLSQAGSKKIKLSRVNLSKMLNEMWFKRTRSGGSRDVTFNVQEDIIVWADISLMEMLLDVLLSNSLRALIDTEKPEIMLNAESGDGYMLIHFRDNGLGFKKEQEEELFKPFSLVHQRKDFDGSGLGLNIAQRIIYRHGGEISAKGEVGSGATITFSLPDQKEIEEQREKKRLSKEKEAVEKNKKLS